MLDNLDRRILKLLESDARQSKSRIAELLQINKAIVTYRVNRLLKKGIITGYQYLTNEAKLGATSFGLLLKFDGLLLPEQEHLLTQVGASKQFGWITLTSGGWDAIAVVVEQDPAAFTQTLDDFFAQFGAHIKEYKFYMDYQGSISSHNYLYDEPYPQVVYYAHTAERIRLSELQQHIVSLCSKHPTMPLLRIAERLGKTYDTIQSHYRLLVTKGVLLKCVPIINHELLGYKNTLCLYNLSPKTERIASLWKFCEAHPHIVRQARCLGNFSLALNIHTQNDRQLKEITSAVEKEFSDIITGYESVCAVNSQILN